MSKLDHIAHILRIHHLLILFIVKVPRLTLNINTRIYILQLLEKFKNQMQTQSWKAIKTIPKKDFQQSLHLMTQHQIDINIVQICLLALNNQQILHWLIEQMHHEQFYLKYRYVLENVLNGKISESMKKIVNISVAKFDQKFINGPEDVEYTQKAIFNMPVQKEKRLKFISDEEIVIKLLDQISLELIKMDDQIEKRQYFERQLEKLNEMLQQKEEQVLKDSSPTVLNGFVFCLGHSLRKLVNINIKNSFFIQTRNRNPLVLDFQFAYFLYKVDDQLSHEIIAMQFIKYFNTILGKQYIVPYEIIPFKKGALYQFIDNAKTIHRIKAENEEGLVSYVQNLGKNTSQEDVMSKFAESYSGFCLIQHMLDIKDRNNGNIMIRDDGAIFHIDLAFIFGSGPGGMSFESAPFKMTKEYIKVFGGFQSDAFRKFQSLMVQHFTKLLECKDQLIWKLQILGHRNKQIRCFKDFKYDQYIKKLPKKQQKVKQLVESLIDASYDSWKTSKYDDFQFKSNHVLK